MATIRNTTDDFQDPAEQLLFLASGLATGSADEYITAQERAGQAQVVNSDRLPTKTHEGDKPYLDLGFTFGDPDPGDPLFRPATLPPGWTRRAIDHAMGSEIADEHGRGRVSIFYKAAFYDRKADMYLISHYGYLSDALFYDKRPVLDDVWLTRESAIAELDRMAAVEDERATEADEFAKGGDAYWLKQAPKHRAEAEKIRALAATL